MAIAKVMCGYPRVLTTPWGYRAEAQTKNRTEETITMALITKYTCPIAVSRNRAEDDVIIAAQMAAVDLAVQYGIESVKHSEQLGLCYLTSARRTRGGIDATWRSETAIIQDFQNNVINAINNK